MGTRLINGAIFLHIPKTGGSFIEKYLKNQKLIQSKAGGMHDDIFRSLYPQDWPHRANNVITELPNKLINHFKKDAAHDWTTGPRPNQPTLESLPYMFCFVRNPIAWIESYYSFTVKQNWYYWSSEYDYYGFWHPNAVLNDLRSDSFNQFIEKLLNKRPGYVTEMFGWYTTAGIRAIGHTENLRQDLANILDQLQLTYDKNLLFGMEKVNVSQSKSNAIQWDPALKQEFIKTEYAGFKRYGYSTDDI